MIRGEVYRRRERLAERGGKPGCYVVVSRTFISENDDVSTVICAPVYSESLGISTEVVIGTNEGVRRRSAVRCDFLTPRFKQKLAHCVGTLSGEKLAELDRTLALALDLPIRPR